MIQVNEIMTSDINIKKTGKRIFTNYDILLSINMSCYDVN